MGVNSLHGFLEFAVQIADVAERYDDDQEYGDERICFLGREVGGDSQDRDKQE